MPFLSLFHPPSPAPLLIDTADLANMADDQLRARLSDIAQQRRLAADAHAQRVAPLLERREALLAEAAKLESEIAYQGILRGDEERARDRDEQRLQAELRGRVVVVGDGADLDDDVVDQRAADRLLERMLSGAVQRNMVVAGNATTTEACRRFDALEARLRSFARQAVQTSHVTGRMPDFPDDLGGFSDQLRREICAKERLRI